MLVNRRVIDLSHHNTIISWPQIVGAGIVGIIHKATEGGSYIDPNYAARRPAAENVGLKWGAYHFGTGSNIDVQAEHFLDIVGIHPDLLYALDWEDNPAGASMTAAQARRFIEIVEAEIGSHRCVIYSGNRAKEQLGNVPDPFFGTRRLWLAHYSSNPKWQASWERPWLWQYSDGSVGPQPHGCPGITGEVDTNSWDGNDVDLRAEWSGAGVPPHDIRWMQTKLGVVADGIVGPITIQKMIEYLERSGA